MPNEEREVVSFRDIVESKEFKADSSKVSFALREKH